MDPFDDLVEDEEDIREMVHFNLFKERYEVLLASDGQTALDIATNEIPDLIVLDVMIPKIDGFEVHFLTGTDEHGLKIQRSAEKNKKTPTSRTMFFDFHA